MKYTEKQMAEQLKKDYTLYTWANARPEDAGIHALLVRKGYLFSKKYEKEHPEICDIVTEKGHELMEKYEL